MNEEEPEFYYDETMNTDQFAGWECPKCEEKGDDGEINNEDGLTQLGFEPFNGVNIECGKCKQEYSLSMYVNVMSL